ncbi:WD40/YVTN/BNR-like repeat-containing protein [Carnobacterium antarcticum]|uniref:WD40/YVTN/BNR-like repeat-containing protein n=1 Tax=Carnobacterium antarcticum TaxID=2126436 RepID=A0ABW4NQB6_9LACT|nr:hypothetical protein [Carnobacterium sp. CP1]ALV22805.1 putative membrane protein [Carnobacterium sp. CP1]
MKKKDYKWRALVFNPIIVVVYGIGCYSLSLLAKYGGVALRAPIILIAFLSLFIWFAWCLYRSKRKRSTTKKRTSSALEKISKLWVMVSTISLVVITFATGINIYQSGTNLQGKLAFVIEDLFNKRKVEFVHDNVYKDDLDGLFADLQTKIDLPNELYLSNHFDLTFTKDGQITSLYSFLYGLNDDGEIKSFLIDYDRSKSNDITVYLNGYTDTPFDETMKLRPLINNVKNLPIKETVDDWNEETLGIYYAGYRSWGYNTEGILYFDEEGDTFPIETAKDEITGYTISVYAPNSSGITPVRFVDYSSISDSLQDKVSIANQDKNDEETYFINEYLGYQLSVVDAAAGSRFYTLNQTLDGGNTWEIFNPNPFSGEIGTSTGITFIDEKLGFIGLSHGGSTYADLYRTTDGGSTFEKVELPTIEVPLTDTEKYAPFDFPEMPSKENGNLFLLVGQGEDGDHNGGSKVLYRSTDDGATWEYAEEII